jgi:hypothetical protein
MCLGPQGLQIGDRCIKFVALFSQLDQLLVGALDPVF